MQNEAPRRQQPVSRAEQVEEKFEVGALYKNSLGNKFIGVTESLNERDPTSTRNYVRDLYGNVYDFDGKQYSKLIEQRMKHSPPVSPDSDSPGKASLTGGKRRTRRRQRSNKKRTKRKANKKTKTRMKKRKTSKRKTNKRRRKR
jgi:hypothetical protein